MLWFELIRVAFNALLANKIRSLLAMLSIIIGIGSVVATMALGEGASKAITDRLEELDLQQLEILSNWYEVRPGRWEQASPTYEDYVALRDNMTLAEYVLPELYAEYDYEYRARTERFNSIGVPTNYYEMFGYRMAAGRFFSDLDGEMRRRVIVLCYDPAKKFAGDEPFATLIGETVRMNGQTYEIIGVLQPGGMKSGRNLDDDVLLPLETVRHRVMGKAANEWRGTYFEMRVRVISQDRVMDAMNEIERILRKSQRLAPGQMNRFHIHYKPLGTQLSGQVAQTFTYLLVSIAAISLIVGGVGVMNIMLVSVTERTREIGVRKALGARWTNILWQFLAEAIVLCLFGGAIGLAAGWGATKYLTNQYNWTMVIVPESLALAVGCAIVVGIISGTYPALRAAFRDPVEALRFE